MSEESEPGKARADDEVGTSDSLALARALPTVLLHDHLDGGVRPATLVELAAQVGHALPCTDPDELGAWFVASCTGGTLADYLATFEHTVACLQTASALTRVAREAVLDLADDGVVLAELRWAPEQHQRAGLDLDAAVRAVTAGIDEGVAEAAASGRTIRVGQLLCAMRQGDRAAQVAAVALAHRGPVVGFDLAGPEAGFPAERAADAFALLRAADLPFTVHAGEAAGMDSVAGAVHQGAWRLGHGLAVAGALDPTSPLADAIRDRPVVLECCPSSNVQTGGATSVAAHPVTALARAGFAVTVNTDNRLQSGTSLSRELALLVDEAGWTWQDVRDATVTAARAAFRHHDEREALVHEVIGPAFERATEGRYPR